MSGLLAAKTIAAFKHLFNYISVAYVRLFNIYSMFISHYRKSNIAHYSSNNSVSAKFAVFF
ncbi:hypothetical protein SDC9_163070 [bioreactor metagenome]|uniref:Uncharacterized protein n=1 Tax=bioreactor metagenome TaxID=1076179 RepID=A0A645FPV8_9ZZZZ